MKKVLLPLLSFLALITACSKEGGFEKGYLDGSFLFEKNTVLTLGKRERIAPKKVGIPVPSDFSCTLEDAPSWISIAPKKCIITVTSIKAGPFGPYSIKVTTSEGSAHIPISFTVVKPDEAGLPAPTTPPAIGKYYQSIALTSNTNYIATFSATGITFMDATNPYHPNVIKVIPTGPLGSGAPQALVSTSHFIHAATTTGHIISFDWSDLSDPVFANSYLVSSDGGQNYDLATDQVDKVFVANTDNNRFSVVDVSDPLNPVTEYTNNSLGSYGAGVTYANGYAYVTAFAGNVFTFGKDSNGDWELVSEVATVTTQASRPFASDKFLLVPKYGGNELDIFSLKNKGTPTHIQTLNVTDNIQIYSRTFIHDNKIYVSTIGPSAGKILIYDITQDQNFNLSETLKPKNAAGDFYSQLSLSLFRNRSFIVYIGLDLVTPAKREIRTKSFPLQF